MTGLSFRTELTCVGYLQYGAVAVPEVSYC
jgi:hypothetical protein